MDAIVARLAWLVLQSDAGSRYDAPLWVWIVVAVVAVGLSLAGLLIGRWFHARHARLEED